MITYLQNNYPEVLSDLVEHLWLALIPVVVGAALSLPLGYLAVSTFAPDTFWWVVAFHLLVGGACGLALQAIVRHAGWPSWDRSSRAAPAS